MQARLQCLECVCNAALLLLKVGCRLADALIFGAQMSKSCSLFWGSLQHQQVRHVLESIQSNSKIAAQRRCMLYACNPDTHHFQLYLI